MSQSSFKKQKKNLYDLLKKISLINNVLSINIVGSFEEKKNLNKLGDLDLVIISKKINKKFMNNCKKIIKTHNFKINKKLKINDTFGPLKYDKNLYFTVHLMIYDLKGHINHCTKSPFTTFDWERSKIFKLKSLSNLYSANSIQLDDFFNSRRSINSHFEDLKNNKITTYSYDFKKNYYLLKFKKIPLNNLNKLNYSKHIYEHSISNFYKFWHQKNIKLRKKNETKFLKKIGLNKNFSREINYSYLRKDLNIDIKVKQFLNNFFDKLKIIKKKTPEVIFIRHAKTKLNHKKVFSGINNENVIDKAKKINRSFDLVISSPLKRAVQTAKMFKTNKIIKNKFLQEIDYGKAEGINIDELSKFYPNIIKKWKKKIDTRFPNGENNKDVNIRVKKFIRKLLLLHNKNSFNKCLVVSHNVFLRCLIGHYYNVKKEDWFKLKINHLKYLKFIIFNGNLIPNISRFELKKIFNYQINELSSTN